MSLRRLALVGLVAAHIACAGQKPASFPPLGIDEFWQLSARLSEPAGDFEGADNLVSNEVLYAQFAQLIRVRGGAYVGVGPEQNFSYIARIQPSVAFIVDIRQDNRNLHLMYKALFAAAADRADFLARLFSRPRPENLQRDTSVGDLFRGFEAVSPSRELLDRTRRLIREQLLPGEGIPLSAADLTSIDQALSAFYADGPSIRYGRALPPSKTRPSYRTLMTVADLRGNAQSFLATEDAFRFVKQLHARNLIIPVVGDFSGPHTLRQIGDYLRVHGQVLSVFYGSNVEVYLSRDQRRTFCASLASMPYDEDTLFIGSRRLQRHTAKLNACGRIQPSMILPKELGGTGS